MADSEIETEPEAELKTEEPAAEEAVVDDDVVAEELAIEDEAAADEDVAADIEVTPEHRQAVEAIILVAEDPVPPHTLGMLTSLPPDIINDICTELAAEYEAQDRGFRLARVGGGYRFQTAQATAPYVERFVLEGQTTRLSAAALETLAIVAYKQPLSRIQVAAIRGVNVDAVMRTLQSRGYIDDIGRDPGPGQATLFGTTQMFLEKMGLDSLGQLPALGDFMPAPEVVEILEQTLRPERMDVDAAVDAATGLLSEEEAVAVEEAVEVEEPSEAGETEQADAAEEESTIVYGDGAVIIDLTERAQSSADAEAPDASPAPVD